MYKIISIMWSFPGTKNVVSLLANFGFTFYGVCFFLKNILVPVLPQNGSLINSNKFVQEKTHGIPPNYMVSTNKDKVCGTQLFLVTAGQ